MRRTTPSLGRDGRVIGHNKGLVSPGAAWREAKYNQVYKLVASKYESHWVGDVVARRVAENAVISPSRYRRP